MSNTIAKERPILFNGDMVRAIMDGRKTQTRRALKPKTLEKLKCAARIGECMSLEADIQDWDYFYYFCPYGQPGDRLWVKETWKPGIVHHCAMDACDCEDVWVDYSAGGEGKYFSDPDIPEEWLMPKAASGKGNVSPLFMPRWASRITLEITDVRVERLQEISEEDAKAEGVWTGAYDSDRLSENVSHAAAFSSLWDSVNGPGAWSTNPWVWVVSFRRVKS